MIRRVLPAIVLTSFLAMAGPAHAADRCAAPASLSVPVARLPHVQQALVRHAPLRIVTIGSSSTEGVGASTPAATYPARLEAILDRRHPDLPVQVLNRGKGGESIVETAPRLERDAVAARPELVIWQLGTNDPMRGVKPETFRALAAEGIRQIRAGGADVILIEPQFLPDQEANPAYREAIAAVRAVGAAAGVPVFKRHDVMTYWLKAGRFTVPAMLSPDGLHMTDASYDCMAELLADALDPALDPALMVANADAATRVR